jgi:hypothetical protein
MYYLSAHLWETLIEKYKLYLFFFLDKKEPKNQGIIHFLTLRQGEKPKTK